MAIRKIVTEPDSFLRQTSKAVEEITPRICRLLDDMADTMYAADGVGLAAVQVGILRRVVVIDTGDGLMELINPRIVEQSGEQDGMEACLSVPGKHAFIKRPRFVRVQAQDRSGEWKEYSGEGLTARAFCHELAHLDGQLYIDLADKVYTDQ